MATIEQLERKIQILKQQLKEKIETSANPSADRAVRMARKKVKRAQRRLRVLRARESKKASSGSQSTG
jgi:hypothetical protein